MPHCKQHNILTICPDMQLYIERCQNSEKALNQHNHICLEVPEQTASTNNRICFMKIPAGEYAVLQFKGKKEQVNDAYNFLYGFWLLTGKYFPGDSNSYEIYHTDPNLNPEGIFVMEICMPIKRF